MGAFLEGHCSLCPTGVGGCSRTLCLIIPRNVHLKQYFHMSVQFNIWVTPSSRLQNTPQHASSGQPVMQHVTESGGERCAIIKGGWGGGLFSQDTQSEDRSEVAVRHVRANQHGSKNSRAQPLFVLKEHSNNRDNAQRWCCTELIG